MASNAAGTSLRTLIGFSVLIIQNVLITNVECMNGSSIDECPQKCSCDARTLTVNCANANYNTVPPNLPPGTLSLILDGNPLNSLMNESLSRLVEVRNLSVRNCGIGEVDKNGFSHLSENLRVLWMSNNPLKNTACRFLTHLQKLEALDLSGCGIGAYPTILKDLPLLKYLSLTKNRIEHFPRTTISPTLESLNLSWNQIKGLKNQQNRKRKVVALPVVSRNLRPRKKPYSKQKPAEKVVATYSRLKRLILRGNPIKEIINNSFQTFPNLELLDLSQNLALRDVEPLAFRSDSLKIIKLYGSKFRLHEHNWNIFHEAPNIRKINIGFARIECGKDLMSAAFQNFSKLTDLELSGTQIDDLSQMFVNLPKLAKLRLQHHRISTLKREDFEGIEDSLRELILSSGKLSTINFESLPKKVWKNLKVVDFSNNRFLCDCNFIWLRRWLQRANDSKRVEVKGWNKYHCQTSGGQVSMLQLERPSDSDCFHDPLFEDSVLLTVLLLTSLTWILASATSTLHRFRWHLRYWYFMKTMNAKKGSDRYLDVDELDNFTFDAFVGYSRSDSNWVISQLLPRLEEECNLRLCIHERDWLPGRDIAENILDSIDNSRKTLLIVSNAFALSPWCHFELTMAQTRLMEEDRDSLVLILLEEISDCNLTPRLGIQMQRRAYMEWTKDSNVGQQLFWANLKHILAKPSDSLMNASIPTQFLLK